VAIHVVLVHPEIHWNTGNAGRTCLSGWEIEVAARGDTIDGTAHSWSVRQSPATRYALSYHGSPRRPSQCARVRRLGDGGRTRQVTRGSIR
jgi:hypothetical protein